MKNWLGVIIIIGVFHSTSAQFVFTKQWDKRYGGDNAEAPQDLALSDSGYLFAGYSDSDLSGDIVQTSRGSYDYWIVRTGAGGDKLWDKRYGGQGGDFLNSIHTTLDHCFILGGTSGSYANGDKSENTRGNLDYWVVKIDYDGNKIWDKRFGGNLNDNMFALSVTNDGGYIMGGYSNSGLGGDKTEANRDSFHFYDDYWIVKIDSLGNKQWDKTLGGAQQDGLVDICVTGDGGYLLGGTSSSLASGDKSQNTWGDSDYWVVKIDSLGNKQWDKRYGTVGDDRFDRFIPISNNRFILAGETDGGISGDKTNAKVGYWLVTIDFDGNILRQWVFDGNSTLDGATSTKDGGYVFFGAGESPNQLGGEDKTEFNLGRRQIWIIKIDSNGNKLWDKTIFTPGYDTGGCLLETVDGCYVVAMQNSSDVGGYKTQPAWNESNDIFVVKFCMEEYNSIEERVDTSNLGRILLWPNPFTSEVSIALNGSYTSSATFTITNTVTGQIVYQQTETNLAAGYTKMLDLSYLSNGVYFIEVSTEQRKYVQRVVKQ